MLELKGLLTKACDILGLKNPCAVSPLSVTRGCCDFTRDEARLPQGVPEEFQPQGAPVKQGVWAVQQPPAWRGFSGVRVEVPSRPGLQLQGCYKYTPWEFPSTLRGGEPDVQLVEALSHGDVDINIDEISLWSQTREA